MPFLRKMQIENAKKKEADNQKDELSKQSFQCQRIEKKW